MSYVLGCFGRGSGVMVGTCIKIAMYGHKYLVKIYMWRWINVRYYEFERVFRQKCAKDVCFPSTYIILYILLGYIDILGIRFEKRQINAHLRHF